MGATDAARAHRDGWTPARAWDSGLLLVVLATCARLVYLWLACPYTLVEDEAHYWDWSRHPDWSYYSKGPGVAWLIGATRAMLGESEASIRTSAAIASGLGALCAAGLARELSGRPRAGLYGAGIFLLAPAFQVVGLLMTIDGPYLAAWAAGCWAGRRAIARGRTIDFVLLGAALGAGFLFKYTIVLLVPGLIGAALAERSRARAGGWVLTACVALLGLVPVVIWNASHDWATVRHLLGHVGAPGGDAGAERSAYSPLWTLEFVGVQLGMAGPLVLLAVYAACWARRREDWRAARYCLWCALPILLFYLGVTAFTEVEGNWPIAGYVPLGVLGAVGLSDATTGARRARAEGRRVFVHRVMAWRATLWYGVVVALVLPRLDLAARIPVLAGRVPLGRVMFADVRAADADARVRALTAETGREVFVLALHYGRASQLAYYMEGRPVVYCASGVTGGRRTQFDEWAFTGLRGERVLDSLRGRPALLVGGEPEEHWEGAFERVEDAGELEGETKRGRRVYIGYGFRGFGSGVDEGVGSGEETGQ